MILNFLGNKIFILLELFRSMDPKEKGYLLEEDLRKLLKGKNGISADDVEEMITEYKVYLKRGNFFFLFKFV